MSEEEGYKPNNNIRRKLSKRKKWNARKSCACGGLRRYEMSSCFRPGGRACQTRSERKMWRED